MAVNYTLNGLVACRLTDLACHTRRVNLIWGKNGIRTSLRHGRPEFFFEINLCTVLKLTFGDVRNLKIKTAGQIVEEDKGATRQGGFKWSSASLRHVGLSR